ncbi:MAG: Coenzyme F420 hydrogenase/dehydrogenase, beta subunit C-terminal domain [Chloroflexota bacterium]|nr:MAG: Coenzyme F420 hydrogenase/dehydrogenase, beta subunit C-terminal domain [Chloroflexota bacterium]
MAAESKGCKGLFDEVIDAGLCTLCGACTGRCPYLAYYQGRIALLDNCTRIDEAQCYDYCPRTHIDMNAISQKIFGVQYSDGEIGNTKEVLIARSTDANITEKAQYGGVVTTLLSLALDEGFIEGAILTKTSDGKTPSPFLAQAVNDILQCAGSSYMACPVLERYNQIPEDNSDKLGIVAMPCQVLAVAKMKANPPANRASIDNIRLVIGLFCTWALSPQNFYQFLKENLDLSEVKKFDIPPPPANRFDIFTASSKTSFPLEKIRKFTMPTCAYCLDMTSEFADISVGSVEDIEGWNTVIVRTKIGAELMEMAKKKGKLQIDKLPSASLAHLKEASLLKKKRALNEIIKRSGDRNNLIYVGLSTKLAEKILE